MAYTGVQRPTNKIVASGTPLIEELKVETATNVYPGRLVKQGTNEDDIDVADASTNTTIVGWAGYEQTNPNYRPSTPTTTYAEDDQIAVLNGGGFTILAACTGTNGTISKGNRLTADGAGKVTVMSFAMMDEAIHVGYAADASSNSKVLVRSVI